MITHRPMSSNAIAALLLTFVCDVSASASESAQPLAQFLEEARQNQTAISAAIRHHQDVVESLRQLRAEGHASFLEVAAAECTVQKLEVRKQSAGEYHRFLLSVRQQVPDADSLPSVAGSPAGVLLIIPGLYETAVTRGVSVVQLPAHPELTELLREQHRPSLSLQRRPFLVPARSITPCTFAGQPIRNTFQLLSIINHKSGHLMLQSDHADAQIEVNWLKSLRQRLTGIHATAVPPGELFSVTQQIEASEERRSRTERQLHQIQALAGNVASRPRSTVLTGSFTIIPRNVLHQAAEQKVHDTQMLLQSLDQRLLALHAHVETIQQLAAEDTFFAAEAKRALLQRAVLRAERAAADHLAGQQLLEARLLKAIYPADSHQLTGMQAWYPLLQSLFTHMSDHTAEIQSTASKREVAVWKLTGTRKLAGEGFASRSEVLQAEVRLAEADDHIDMCLRRQRDLQQIATVLAHIQPDLLTTVAAAD